MDEQMKSTARQCLAGAEAGSMTFPGILAALTQAGFEGYFVDFRRGAVIYYLPSGESIELSGAVPTAPVAIGFNATQVKEAIREAQVAAPGYTYKGFIEKVAEAGCAGYLVSILGRRVLYFGRTADLHIEHFPGSK